MAKYKKTNIGKSCSLQSFANTTGLKVDEMHLAIETSLVGLGDPKLSAEWWRS